MVPSHILDGSRDSKGGVVKVCYNSMLSHNKGGKVLKESLYRIIKFYHS
jgi:hypothetical protein